MKYFLLKVFYRKEYKTWDGDKWQINGYDYNDILLVKATDINEATNKIKSHKRFKEYIVFKIENLTIL